MSKVVIQLAYDDLVRLIGDDSQAMIELREGIVQTFAKTHLKPIANADAFKAIKEEIDQALKRVHAEARAEVARQIGGVQSSTYIGSYVQLTKEVTNSIHAEVRTLKEESIRDATTTFMKEVYPTLAADIMQALRDRVETRLKIETEALIGAEIDRRLAAIRRRLGENGA